MIVAVFSSYHTEFPGYGEWENGWDFMLCPRVGDPTTSTGENIGICSIPEGVRGRIALPWPELKFYVAMKLGWKKPT